MKRLGWVHRLPALVSHCRLGKARPDRHAINFPVNESLAHARHVTIHVVSVNGQQAPPGSLVAAVAGFSQYLAGEVHLAESPRSR